MTQIPIACTLLAADRTTRSNEWRGFVADNVSEVVRSESSVRMRLKGGDGVIVSAVDLARREKDCCAFFEFRLELLPGAIWLDIAGPDEAGPILDGFVGTGTN